MAVDLLLIDCIYHIGKKNYRFHIDPHLFQSEAKVSTQHCMLEVREPLGTEDLRGTE